MSETAQIPKAPLARKLLIDLSIMTAIGVLLAFLGPFGTINQPLAVRLVSWVMFAWIGYAIYSPISLLVDRLEAALALPRPALWFLGVLLATIPMTAAVWTIGFAPNWPVMPSLEQALTSYFYVFLVGGAVTAFFYVMETRKADVSVEAFLVPALDDSDSPEEPPIRFRERIPPHLGEELLALEMEDHYVRVHTALGSDLVLMRMRDAVAELDALEGAQVHRSWWVARDAVTGSTKDGRNVRLVLKGGLEAPVSRTNAPVLKQSGWY